MKKKVFILILFFGFFLMPTAAFACGKSCGALQQTKNCCQKENSNSDKKQCGGKCKNPSCQTSSPNYTFLIPINFEIKAVVSGFTLQKNAFSLLICTISKGFYFIWTPPNIS